MSLSWARSLKHTSRHITIKRPRKLKFSQINLIIWPESFISTGHNMFKHSHKTWITFHLWTVSISAWISLSSSISFLAALTVSRLDNSRRPSFSTPRISSWQSNNEPHKTSVNTEAAQRSSNNYVKKTKWHIESSWQPSSVGICGCGNAAGILWH